MLDIGKVFPAIINVNKLSIGVQIKFYFVSLKLKLAV